MLTAFLCKAGNGNLQPAVQEGYRSAALKLLTSYYKGFLTMDLEDELDNITTNEDLPIIYSRKVSMQEETIVPKQNLPPLLVPVSERLQERIFYIGASFGLTTELFSFWKKHEFLPLHISQNPNGVTGERSCMVLKQLKEHRYSMEYRFSNELYKHFSSKFIRNIPHFFRDLDYKLVLNILNPSLSRLLSMRPEESESSKSLIESADFNQLEAYINDNFDYKEVFHIATTLAQNYFNGKYAISLPDFEASILLSIGLQLKDLSSLEGSLKLESSQIRTKFYKLMKKFYEYLKEELMKKISSSFPSRSREVKMNPHDISVDDDLNDGARKGYGKSMEDENVGWQDNSNGNRGNDFQNHRYSSPSNHMGVCSPSYCNENSKQSSSPVMVSKNKRRATCSTLNSSTSEKKKRNFQFYE
uniref:Uncharacterized protein n=1 Tax=Cucumis sativus TaxID=3659 RepID=A0A0A0LX37_CUCSA